MGSIIIYKIPENPMSLNAAKKAMKFIDLGISSLLKNAPKTRLFDINQRSSGLYWTGVLCHGVEVGKRALLEYCPQDQNCIKQFAEQALHSRTIQASLVLGNTRFEFEDLANSNMGGKGIKVEKDGERFYIFITGREGQPKDSHEIRMNKDHSVYCDLIQAHEIEATGEDDLIDVSDLRYQNVELLSVAISNCEKGLWHEDAA
jgi:hypothetical protein